MTRKPARTVCLCYVKRREDIGLLLAKSPFGEVVRNVIAFRHRSLRNWIPIQATSRTTVCTHHLKHTTSPNLDLLLPTRSVLTVTQVKIARWRLRANDLEWLSSTSSSVGRERSSLRKIRSKGVEGPTSNTLYDGNFPG